MSSRCSLFADRRVVAAGPGAGRAARTDHHLVAGRAALFALRGNTVVTFDGGGREIARCPRFEAPPRARQRGARRRAVDADAALSLAGLARRRLPDAGSRRGAGRRRARRPATARARRGGGTVVRALAAVGVADDVWIATSAGLYRGRDGACARVALAGRDVIAVAAAAAPSWPRPTTCCGERPTVRPLAGRRRADAEAASARGGRRGAQLRRDDDGVIEIGPYGVRGACWIGRRGDRRVRRRGARARARRRLVLDAGRAAGARRRSAARAGARVRRGTSARFVATGDGLYTSHDGATWIRAASKGVAGSLPAPRGRRPPAGWRSTTGGRARSGLSARVAVATLAPTPALAPLDTGRLLAPAAPWPQVSLVFAAQRTPLTIRLVGRRAVRVPAGARGRWRAAIGGGWRPSWFERDAGAGGAEASRLVGLRGRTRACWMPCTPGDERRCDDRSSHGAVQLPGHAARARRRRRPPASPGPPAGHAAAAGGGCCARSLPAIRRSTRCAPPRARWR